MTGETAGTRPHTGRRRNEEARQAILAAAFDLLTESTDGDGRPVLTMEAIAHRAGVGKQTIYRWWPSKGAVVLEALTENARTIVPIPDTGSLRGDLVAFLTSTFHGAHESGTVKMLRTLMAEAQTDPHVRELVRAFTTQRREELKAILLRGETTGELPAGAELQLSLDIVFGVLWYRIMLDRGPIGDDDAVRLADAALAVIQG